ncbi:MAG: phage head morphogenesis protein [Clostridium sp.]|nr:phage head morphogenesis protein [Clostridium sp.]MCM1547928.1 phage head morphogenesis protein [Ruminococcus sp.]
MKNNSDLAHKLTDKELAKLEKRISRIYGKASKEIGDKVKAYFDRFKERDAAQLKKLESGEISKEQYTQWRLAQIGRGKRFEDLRDKLAERMTKANETAAAYINDATPGIYSLNRNYAAYTIEQVAGDVGFTLWDEQTVKRLIVEQPDIMPYYPPERAVKRGFDLKWGKSQITKQVTSGILMGESITHLADRLQKNIPDMNRTSAVRAARTAVTGAQNAGRLDGYHAAEKMGIKLKKQWLATLDNRTRHSHAALDGVAVENDKKFPNGCMFPGDPNGPPHEVYNCRCTLVSDVDGSDTSDAKRRARDPVTGKSEVIEDMTYQQWIAQKRKQYGDEAVDMSFKKARNEDLDIRQFKEYKKILGKDMPKTLETFRDLKYNDTKEWETLKTKKRQTVFVENAACVTTPKKYTGYFLKPGAKHADQFFDVGYTQDNPLKLRYDMARQFDMSKAVDVKELDGGARKFNIYMELGITKKRNFCTGWIQDTPDSLPRVVTGFRKKRGGRDDT